MGYEGVQIIKEEGGICKIEEDLMSLGHMAGCRWGEGNGGVLEMTIWKGSI